MCYVSTLLNLLNRVSVPFPYSFWKYFLFASCNFKTMFFIIAFRGSLLFLRRFRNMPERLPYNYVFHSHLFLCEYTRHKFIWGLHSNTPILPSIFNTIGNSLSILMKSVQMAVFRSVVCISGYVRATSLTRCGFWIGYCWVKRHQNTK